MTEGEMFAALIAAQCTAFLIFFVGVWCHGPRWAAEDRASRLAASLSRVPFDRLTSAYQWVIIDCPPRLGEATLAAVAVADLVLIPIRPTSMDLQVLPATLKATEGHPLTRGVITQRPPRSTAADSAPDAIRAAGLIPLTSSIAFRQDYPDAHSLGMSALRAAPKSKAAAEIRALLKEVRTLLKGSP